MASAQGNFRYLNREGRWPDFLWQGLEIGADGALRLFTSPRRQGDAAPVAPSAPISTPAGVAVDAHGRVFYTVPDLNQLWQKQDCGSDWALIEGATEREGLGSLKTPRGLCVLERSQRLVVVDSAHRRLLFLDLNDSLLREVWGGSFGPSGCRDAFREPWTVSADAAENLYVLDVGGQRLLKFSRLGDLDRGFGDRIAASGLVTRPRAVAVAERAGGVRVFIFDQATNRIRIFDGAGDPMLDAQGRAVSICYAGMGGVVAMALDADTLYVGDNHGQRLLTFRTAPGLPFAGDAVGYAQSTAALALDGRGHLDAHSGSAEPPTRLEAKGAYVAAGTLWSGPLRASSLPVVWSRLRATLTSAPSAHIELSYALSSEPAVPPLHPSAELPFPASRWKTFPADVGEGFLEGGKELYAFVGARFSGDRLSSVALSQLRLDFDTEGYDAYLPAIYREPESDNAFLHRYLALFQSVFDEIDAEIGSLASYFDPAAAPVSALPWLAGWLATEIDREEPVDRIRSSIASAFERQKKRGTAEGLRRALLEEAGVHANISEPLAAAEPFRMPAPVECGGATELQAPALGFATHLIGVEPGGAVLGTTAALDRSYLITDSQFGEPIFEEAAHQFVVEVYKGEVSTPTRLERVRSIIERDKPAHTLYRLEVLDSGLSVGHQARVGVDTLLGGSSAPSAVGLAADAFGIRLGGEAAPRVGQSRLGEDITL